jgi:hypothetical protein
MSKAAVNTTKVPRRTIPAIFVVICETFSTYFRSSLCSDFNEPVTLFNRAFAIPTFLGTFGAKILALLKWTASLGRSVYRKGRARRGARTSSVFKQRQALQTNPEWPRFTDC